MNSNEIGGIPALTVTAVGKELKRSIPQIFPSGVWIEGEIAEMKDEAHSSGRYFKLIDGENKNKYSLNMKLFARSGVQERVEKKMSAIGFPLANGMRVRFLCRLDFYELKGEVGCIIQDVDTNFTLGNIAQKREQLIAKLIAGGYDKKNKQIRVPSVPLRFGVVSSSQADGWKDALKQFQESKFSFHIVFCASAVQGLSAPDELVAAIRTLDRRNDIDVILVMRGGGSKADLAAFDDEKVAMCIAHCRHPVFTGIGHAPDISIADLVAHTQCKTPTAVAEEIILKVRRFRNHLDNRAQTAVEGARRGISHSRRKTSRSSELLAARSRSGLTIARDKNNRFASRIKSRPVNIFEAERSKIKGLTSTVRLLDPATTLAKGWSLTRDSQGQLIRSTSQTKVGDVITTSFVDGFVHSEVKGVE